MGDEMTEFQYTVRDGVGSLLGVGAMPIAISRFNRAPTGGRFTGPNARACGDCHDAPQGNAAGDNVNNVLQNPEPAVDGPFNARNTRNINGDAWLELAAIEMTVDLQTQLASCKANARAGTQQTLELVTKGVPFRIDRLLGQRRRGARRLLAGARRQRRPGGSPAGLERQRAVVPRLQRRRRVRRDGHDVGSFRLRGARRALASGRPRVDRRPRRRRRPTSRTRCRWAT